MNSSWQSSHGLAPSSLLPTVESLFILEPNFVADAPTKKLTLSFVNGFKIEDSRQNMFWGKNPDEIIYCAAALGIVMNVKTLAQKYMGAGLQS